MCGRGQVGEPGAARQPLGGGGAAAGRPVEQAAEQRLERRPLLGGRGAHRGGGGGETAAPRFRRPGHTPATGAREATPPPPRPLPPGRASAGSVQFRHFAVHARGGVAQAPATISPTTSRRASPRARRRKRARRRVRAGKSLAVLVRAARRRGEISAAAAGAACAPRRAATDVSVPSNVRVASRTSCMPRWAVLRGDALGVALERLEVRRRGGARRRSEHRRDETRGGSASSSAMCSARGMRRARGARVGD